MPQSVSDIVINGKAVSVPAARLHDSLLSVLREDLGLTGTKEGCASGDCGACTVVVATPGAGIHTLNSCITPAGAVAGGAVLTVDGVATEDQLHPIQQAMVSEHGAQCGFCTPGFVMSMVGDQLIRKAPPSRQQAMIAVSGNLCRCTGYRPILDALQNASVQSDDQPYAWLQPSQTSADGTATYQLPTTLQALAEVMQSNREVPLILAGSTDAGLLMAQQYEDFSFIVDLSRISEMQHITRQENTLFVGAATTHAELLNYFSQAHRVTAICKVLERFGSPQIRARGTIGGNIGNASPIADWPPLLLVLDAQLHVMSADGTQRTTPLDGFYTGYRQTLLEPGDIITQIECLLPNETELFAGKISKRTEDDISSVLMAVRLVVDDSGVLELVRLAFGGVAATPVRVQALEDVLQGLNLQAAADRQLIAICDQLDQLIQPISDVRASADYRLQMAKNLLLQALQEKRGDAVEDLHHV